jgi:hypothetical protein
VADPGATVAETAMGEVIDEAGEDWELRGRWIASLSAMAATDRGWRVRLSQDLVLGQRPEAPEPPMTERVGLAGCAPERPGLAVTVSPPTD